MGDGVSSTAGGGANKAGGSAKQHPIDADTVRKEAAQGAEFERIFLEAVATNMVFDGYNDGEKMRSEQWQRQQEDETIS